MHYALSSSLGSMSGLNTDKLALDLQFATDKTLTARRGPTPTFTRASTATFIGSNGLIQSAAINTARFDHDPVTLACKGLLIEESRTNLALRSQEFDNSSWLKGGSQAAVITANNITSPTGDLTADTLTMPSITSGQFSLAAQPFFATATAYTFSCYVKSASGGQTVWISLTPNGVTYFSQSIVLTTEWQRVSLTATLTAATWFAQIGIDRRDASQSGTANFAFHVWGAQLEAGAFPTSYIPTVASTVVRSADVCSITGSAFTGFYNQSEGAILVNAFTPASGDRTIVATDDNTANEMIRLRTEGTNPLFKVTDGGSEVVAIDSGTVSANTSFKLIGAYKVNNFASSINGGSPVTDTAGTIPTVDRMRIGAGQGGNTMCGCISSLRYFKKRVSNSRLQTITT